MINLPQSLREKLGDEAAEALVKVLSEYSNNRNAPIMELMEERFTRRIQDSEISLRLEIAAFRSEFKGEMAGSRAELKEMIDSLKREILDLKSQKASEGNTFQHFLIMQSRSIWIAVVAASVLSPLILYILGRLFQ